MWVHGADQDHFSYMVATDAECLEVVTREEPKVQILPAEAVRITECND
jgi:hypothetical protein